MMEYIVVFISFLQIGCFSIGGGYAALPIIQQQVVSANGWLTLREFADVLTISQMTPGPIAINAATFVGTKIGGIPGALIAVLGVVLPSFFLVVTLSFLYYKYRKLQMVQAVLKGLHPAVVALIASAGVSLAIDVFWQDKDMNITNLRLESVFLFIISFYVLRKYKKNPIVVMIGTGILSLFIGCIQGQLHF